MDTIVAISTPIGHGGISIVRMSGSKSLDIINKVFKLKNPKASIEKNTIKLGKIYDNDEVVDDVLVSYFKAPYSYTGEDVIEVNSHGGILVAKRILNLLIDNGAKLATPGEFTKRAFLNGKLDLSQAEAVMDLINSKSLKENKISVSQLEGKLGKNIRRIKDSMVDLLVDIEAEIDYPEYDLEEVKKEKIFKVVDNNLKELQHLLLTFDEGKLIKNGINVAIVGKPNVGKSSLLNNLLDEERAIVTDIAGTTRDTIEESLSINGILLNIIDTAGIRDTKDVVEEIGVEKSKKAISKSDLVLMLIDSSQDIDSDDLEVYESIKDKKHILLSNKVDLVKEDELKNKLNSIFKDEDIIFISAKEDIGIESLKNKIDSLFSLENIGQSDEIIITNERHKIAISNTINSLKNIIDSINLNVPIDMISIELQNSIKELSLIIGDDVSEDVINGIFKKFCLGK